jgi:rare lipoprotein A
MILTSSTGRKVSVLCWLFLAVQSHETPASSIPQTGSASWYGEEHRGKLMANNRRFNPDKLTAASWFYPLGTKLQVTVSTNSDQKRSVVVTVTDRGPRKDLVQAGRIIDLSLAAFKQLNHPDDGLVAVTVRPLQMSSR